ncbi:UvrB/UvrC motif-containing protein [Staphylococcus pettenkoferi]|uniref:UvrB/UvrC motif-containing protein n=1 Tax=Staphylococcus pettenkoferi TaxID=170573 RepID=UPI00066BF894|nr:UvrB/UvrC motif-containing protein [Staphylococcus pettenkoferi]
MLCENCYLNEAEVKVAVKGHNGTEERWVCVTCAQGGNPWTESQQVHQDDIEGAFVVKQILQHLAAKHGINFEELKHKAEKHCPGCHMTLNDIAHVGKLGCPECYATFKEDIIDIVRRVQGGQFEHIGKTPHSSYKKLALKKQIEEKTSYLNQLVEEQAFEQAAVVRDEIKALKEGVEVDEHE